MEALATDIQSDIRQADDIFERKFQQGNAEGMAELYTNDGMLLPTGSDFVKGRKAIRDFWQGAMDMGIKEAKLSILEVTQEGNIAVEVGNYELKGGTGQVIDQGKYLVTWKQEEGGWKLHRDIWNTSRTA